MVLITASYKMLRTSIHSSSGTQSIESIPSNKEYLWCQGGFPCGSAGKKSTCNVGDLGSIPGLGRAPGEGNGNPLQYSCLENPMDGKAW